MFNLGLSAAIKYGFWAIACVAVVCILIWAYRSARRDGATATQKKEDKVRASIFKALVDKLTTGKPHGSDGFRVRKPGKWSDKL
jgi:hypothetical protein